MINLDVESLRKWGARLYLGYLFDLSKSEWVHVVRKRGDVRPAIYQGHLEIRLQFLVLGKDLLIDNGLGRFVEFDL